MQDVDLSDAVPSLFMCPHAASDMYPKCANSDQCSLSCIMQWVQHVIECARCVNHIICFHDVDSPVKCDNRKCRRVAVTWTFEGEIADLCYRHKLKVQGYVFQRIVKQLEVLLELDFDRIKLIGSKEANPVANHTRIVFDFLALFSKFRTQMTDLGLQLHSSDMIGQLQHCSRTGNE